MERVGEGSGREGKGREGEGKEGEEKCLEKERTREGRKVGIRGERVLVPYLLLCFYA